MADDDELDHVVKNSNRVLRLNPQYENHPYVEKSTKECNVMFVYETYVLEGKTEATFSLGDIWKLFQEDPLPNNASNFCRQMTNCMRAWNYIQKNIRFAPEHRDHQANTQDNEGASGWKRCLGGGIWKVASICMLSNFCTSWPY